MKPFKILALINLKPVTVVSDGTEEGTALIDFYDHEALDFKAAIHFKSNVRIGHGLQTFEEVASYGTPMGIVAALYAVCPSNTMILRAPSETLTKLGHEATELTMGSLPKHV